MIQPVGGQGQLFPVVVTRWQPFPIKTSPFLPSPRPPACSWAVPGLDTHCTGPAPCGVIRGDGRQISSPNPSDIVTPIWHSTVIVAFFFSSSMEMQIAWVGVFTPYNVGGSEKSNQSSPLLCQEKLSPLCQRQRPPKAVVCVGGRAEIGNWAP